MITCQRITIFSLGLFFHVKAFVKMMLCSQNESPMPSSLQPTVSSKGMWCLPPGAPTGPHGTSGITLCLLFQVFRNALWSPFPTHRFHSWRLWSSGLSDWPTWGMGSLSLRLTCRRIHFSLGCFSPACRTEVWWETREKESRAFALRHEFVHDHPHVCSLLVKTFSQRLFPSKHCELENFQMLFPYRQSRFSPFFHEFHSLSLCL